MSLLLETMRERDSWREGHVQLAAQLEQAQLRAAHWEREAHKNRAVADRCNELIDADVDAELLARFNAVLAKCRELADRGFPMVAKEIRDIVTGVSR